MENWWIMWQLSKMKQAQILAEGEEYRHALKVRSKTRPGKFQRNFYCLLGKLGLLLIEWGSLLQRYNRRLKNLASVTCQATRCGSSAPNKRCTT